MRQVTTTTNIYRFSELSDKAKDRAIQTEKEVMGYTWSRDSLKSLEALAKHFDCKLSDYRIDYFNCSYSSATFDCPDMEPEEIESRLSELGSYNPETLKGNGDCKLTGYCMDEEAIDGFRKAWHDGERELSKLMEAAFRSWLQAAQADCEDYYSYDTFGEMAEANDYEYTEDGEFYN